MILEVWFYWVEDDSMFGVILVLLVDVFVLVFCEVMFDFEFVSGVIVVGFDG